MDMPVSQFENCHFSPAGLTVVRVRTGIQELDAINNRVECVTSPFTGFPCNFYEF